MSMQHLIEGLDPTGLECITVADLLQMIRAAKPTPDQGWIIWSDDAPDVVTNPELTTFLWGRTVGGSTPNPLILYYYNGTSWQALLMIDGSLLANNSVPLSKLNLTGSAPFYIIQVDATGLNLVWTSVANAIQNNSLNPSKLLAPDSVNNYVLTSFAGVKAFSTFAQFIAAIVNNTIPPDKLTIGAASTFLRTRSDAAGTIWGQVDVSDIHAAGASAGHAIKRNAGNTGWAYYTPAIPALASGADTAEYELPIGVGIVTIEPGIGVKPKLYRIVLICKTSDNLYNENDEVDITSFFFHDGTSDQFPIVTYYDPAAQKIKAVFAGVTNTLRVLHSDGGSATDIVRANWRVKAYVYA